MASGRPWLKNPPSSGSADLNYCTDVDIDGAHV
jgi:hypothetical protein